MGHGGSEQDPGAGEEWRENRNAHDTCIGQGYQGNPSGHPGHWTLLAALEALGHTDLVPSQVGSRWVHSLHNSGDDWVFFFSRFNGFGCCDSDCHQPGCLGNRLVIIPSGQKLPPSFSVGEEEEEECLAVEEEEEEGMEEEEGGWELVLDADGRLVRQKLGRSKGPRRAKKVLKRLDRVGPSSSHFPEDVEEENQDLFLEDDLEDDDASVEEGEEEEEEEAQERHEVAGSKRIQVCLRSKPWTFHLHDFIF